MSDVRTQPLLKELIPGDLPYGTILLVEFEPQSLWYDASYTITADALRDGVRTEYHTYMHMPSDVRASLARLGFNVNALEQEGRLEIQDSYTIQIGLGGQETGRTFRSKSLKLSDWSIALAQEIKNPPERRRRSLHICDNISVLHRYNPEDSIVDLFRTRVVPLTRLLELTLIESFAAGVHSPAFYRELESLHDGIIDFKSEEREERIEHYVRLRNIRGKTHDSRWRKLRLLDNGAVALAE